MNGLSKCVQIARDMLTHILVFLLKKLYLCSIVWQQSSNIKPEPNPINF